MSISVEYPSEYYKDSITAKGAIEAKVNFAADPVTGDTPLDYLVDNSNQTELKRIIASHPAEVAEIVEDRGLLGICNSVAVFKLLHNCCHSVNKDYKISHFEEAIGTVTGASMCQYAHRVKSDDKVDKNLKDQLTTRGLRNFINNITWSPGKTLNKEKLTPAAECLIYMTDFISTYYDKSDFFEVCEEDGSTPLHELVKSDNLGRFLYVIKAFELDKLEECVDGKGNTLLNWAIQHNAKKIVEYLITTEELPINDEHNDDGINSAGSLFASFSDKNLRLQDYINMIDESNLEDPKLSYLNHARGTKLDLSEVTQMSDKLLEAPTGVKGESYRMLIDANAKMLAAAEEKAQAKAQAAEKK